MWIDRFLRILEKCSSNCQHSHKNIKSNKLKYQKNLLSSFLLFVKAKYKMWWYMVHKGKLLKWQQPQSIPNRKSNHNSISNWKNILFYLIYNHFWLVINNMQLSIVKSNTHSILMLQEYNEAVSSIHPIPSPFLYNLHSTNAWQALLLLET